MKNLNTAVLLFNRLTSKFETEAIKNKNKQTNTVNKPVYKLSYCLI